MPLLLLGTALWAGQRTLGVQVRAITLLESDSVD